MTTSAYLGGGLTVRAEFEQYLDAVVSNAAYYLAGDNFAIQTNEFCSVYNLLGLTGEYDGQSIYCGSYYPYNSVYLGMGGGGGDFVWDSTQVKSGHNGITIISPTVPWNGSQSTLSAFHAGTGETDPSGRGCWIRQFNQLDVLMAGAIRNNSAIDNTVPFQSCINYLTSINYNSFFGGARPSLRTPAGYYVIGSLTASDHVAFVGDGKRSTHLRLKTGVTTPMFTLNAVDTPGSPMETTAHYALFGISLHGNRTDTVANDCHGIYLPDTPWSQGTQYSSSITADDFEIVGFSGRGIHAGSNRNWLLLDNGVIRYSNSDGLLIKGYDSLISNMAIGVNLNYGVWLVGGGGNVFSNCPVYYNGKRNIMIGSFVDHPCSFVNCIFDSSAEEAVYIDGPVGSIISHIINGCRFNGSSRTAGNTYSDIKVARGYAQVIGCNFEYVTQPVKYLVETTSTALKVYWSGNQYDTSGVAGVTPYGTALTNDFTKLIFEGDESAYISPSGGAGTLSQVIGGVETTRASASGFNAYKPTTVTVNSASDALRVTQTGAGNAIVVEDSANPDSTPWLIDGGGNIVHGMTSKLSSGTSTDRVNQQYGGVGAGVAYIRGSNDATAPVIALAKSRGTTPDVRGIVQAGDAAGSFRFCVDDGTDLDCIVASIDAFATGTPAVNDTQGRLTLSVTPAGSNFPVEVLIVDGNRRVATTGRLDISNTARTGTFAPSVAAPTNFYSGAVTFTDGNTAASGTVAHVPVNAFDNPALAATNATVTYTNASTVYIDGAPTASTNITITNPYSLYVASGNSYFGGVVGTTESFTVDGVKVIGNRVAGWTADTGTAKRTANTTYSGAAEGSYTQATIQALMDVVRDQSQTIKALKDDLIAHGLIGS